MLRNDLSVIENELLAKIFEADFLFQDEYINQLSQATIFCEKAEAYISLLFLYQSRPFKHPDNFRTGVPVEMRIYSDDKAPLQILLHVKEGIVSELEMFYADSSPICLDFDLSQCKVQIIVNEKWQVFFGNNS